MFFTMYGHDGYVGHTTCTPFVPTDPGGYTLNSVTVSPAVSEKSFDFVDWWTTETACTTSSPEPLAQVS